MRYRISCAKETASDAEFLIKNKRLRSAVNRIYYAMFYMLMALALKFNYKTSKHQQLISRFLSFGKYG
ncbi:MAG: HEPN domain-containing protein [Candidatus Helarchaeota archaeon]